MHIPAPKTQYGSDAAFTAARAGGRLHVATLHGFRQRPTGRREGGGKKMGSAIRWARRRQAPKSTLDVQLMATSMPVRRTKLHVGLLLTAGTAGDEYGGICV